MVVIFEGGQGFSTRTPIELREQIRASSSGSKSRKRRRRQTTVETPTPSADELVGTKAEREDQLRAFSSGGQSSFERVRDLAVARIEKEALQKAETQQAQIQSRRIEGQITSTGNFRGGQQGTIDVVQDTDRSFSNVFGIGDDISRRQAELRTRGGRGEGTFKSEAELTALGFGKSAVGLAGLFFNPIDTTKSLFGAVKTPVKTAKAISGVASTEFQQDPSGAIGSLLFDASLLVGPTVARKGVTTAVDVTRTRKLAKIAQEDIVAPEFFKGQTFPQIKKGQTAGELLAEFEKRGAGVTSAPKPIKGTTTGRGSSEFPGLFQAPDVSPRFLRVGGKGEEVKLFSAFKEPLRPSVFRIEPTKFELAPGVKTGQKTLNPNIKATQQFFETKAEKGKSVIPFIKTEKEAVIPFSTELIQKPSQEFFKFEGRRIPIFEFKTKGPLGDVGGKKAGGKKTGGKKTSGGFDSLGTGKVGADLGPGAKTREGLGKTPDFNLPKSGGGRKGRRTTAKEISTKSSRSQTGPISELDILSGISLSGPVSRISSFKTPSFKSSFGFPPSRRKAPSGGRSPPASGPGSFFTGSGRGSSRGFVPGGFDLGIPTIQTQSLDFADPFKTPRKKGSGRGKVVKKKKKKQPRFDRRVAPSFTAQILDIQGAFPKVSKQFGISPFSIRKKPRKKKKK